MPSTNNRMKKTPSSTKQFLFRRKNYKVLLVAIGIIAMGFALMAGGGSNDPNLFNEEIFNFRRIRLAPTLVLVGFGIAMYSILLKSNKQ